MRLPIQLAILQEVVCYGLKWSPMSQARAYFRYDDVVFIHPSISEFLATPVQSGIHSILYGGSILDLKVEDRGSETTIFVFHAAVDPKKITLPVFVGQQLTEDLNANIVFVSDPALDIGVPIGWFTGDSHHSFQREFPLVIERISSGLRYSKHLIFFGPSAGGFASLYYSHCFPDSLAIVANPQTNIGKYSENHVKLYQQGCWSGRPLEETGITYDMVPLYREDFPNWVAYLQNEDDELHITQHLTPWKEAVKDRQDRYGILMDDWGPGHAPVPLYLLMGILGFATEVQGDWSSFLSDSMFSH